MESLIFKWVNRIKSLYYSQVMPHEEDERVLKGGNNVFCFLVASMSIESII